MANQLGIQSSARKKLDSKIAARARLKILMVRVRLLYPQDSGGKIRTAKLVEQLAAENDITMVTYRYPEDTSEDVQKTAQFCKKLVTIPYSETPKFSARFYFELASNLLSSLPYVASKYASREMAQTIADIYQKDRPDLIIVDFLQACEAMRDLPNAPFVLFEHNVEAAIFEQLAARAPSFLTRQYLNLQARRMRQYEKKQCRKAQRVIGVSDVDKQVYEKEYGITTCDVVPTGVDTQYFKPTDLPCRVNNLVFTGSMDWLANQDAMKYFVHDIFPMIREEIPDVVFSIVGRNPTPEIQKLGELPGITVTGTVDDIRPYVHSAKVYITPLRIGSGTRIKLLEAMALGKATVSTTIGAEGLPVEHGRNIVLADTPRTFADAVVGLIRNDPWRATLESNARALVERDYSWSRAGRVFNEICYQAALQTRQG